MSKAPLIVRPRDVFRTIQYQPHAGQIRFHKAKARNRVVPAGRRFGKSSMGGAELCIEAHATRGILPTLEQEAMRREFWIVGPEYSDAEKEFRFMYNKLKAAGAPFDKPGTYYDAHSGDMQLSMYQGKFMVLGKSAKHPERLVGEGLSGVIMAEAAKQKESTWSKYIRATLADYKGWAIFSTTPEGKNWLYELYMMGLDETNPEWWSMRAPSWLNPHVYPGGATDVKIRTLRAALDQGGFDWHALVERLDIDTEIAQMVRDLTEETFNQEIAAEFNEFAGRVFKDFDEEVHTGSFPYDPAMPLYAACDYGFTNPFVWLLIQEDVWGNVYVIDEMYERGLTIDEAAAEIDARGLAPSSLQCFYPDPAEPGDTKALEKHLKVRARGGTGGELSRRLRYIRAALKVRNKHLPWGDPERKPKLLIDKRCTHTIYEMGAYRYPRKRSSDDNTNDLEKPLKKDDHTPEALGRFYAGHYGAPEAKNGRARQSTAAIG